MGQAILYGQKQQGVDIQGIIDDYYAYAGENISVGDFVEFVQGVATRTSYNSSSKSFTSNDTKSIGITLIDEDKFLIAYVIPNGSNYKCCAKVGTISGVTITLGTEYTITDTASDVAVISVDTNKCIIVYTSSYDIYGVGCSITNTAITKGNVVSLGTGSSSAQCNNPTLVNMTTNKAVLSYNKNTTAYVVVITLGTTLGLSVKSNTIQPTGYSSWGNVSICHITFTGYESYPNYLLLGRDPNNNVGVLVPILINTNNTVSYITTPSVFYNGSSYYQKACQIAQNKYFIMFVDGGNNYTGKAVICTKGSGDTLSFGAYYTFYDSNNGLYNNKSMNLIAIEENKVIMAYTTRTNSSPSGPNNIEIKIATINSNNEIAFGTRLSIGSANSLYPQLIKLRENTILSAYNYNSTIGYSRIFNCEGDTPSWTFYNYTYETQVRKVTTPQFDGIAQTNGSGGSDAGHNQQVDVLIQALPSAYQLVEYIENTYRQYINTGVIPDDNTDIGIIVSEVNEESSQIFAAGGRYRIVKFTANHLVGVTIGNTSIYSSSSGADKFKAEIINKTFYFDNVSIGSATDTVQTTNTLEIFRGNYGGAAQYHSKFKCYGAYIKQNGILIRNMIPCYRKSDGEIGMYDLVNNVFYTNAGTGTFTKGERQTNIPAIVNTMLERTIVDTNYVSTYNEVVMTSDDNTFIVEEE